MRGSVFSSGFLAIAACSIYSFPAHASGFRILEQSAEQVANANAGAGSQTDSAIVVISNPAGSSDMEGSGLSISASGIFANTKFEDSGSASPVIGPYSGDRSLDRNKFAVLPAFAFYTRVSDQIGINFAGFAPYGNSRDYGGDWVGRYQLTEAKALSYEFNPSVSYEVSDGLAIGFGVGLQYFRAEISNDIDFGTICSLQIDPTLCGNAGILPQGADGASTVDGDDWSLGFNLGLLFRPSDKTRIGLTYRSAVKHELNGRVEFENPALPTPFDAITGQPLTADDDVSGKLELPQTINLSVSQELSPKLTLLADIGWQDWSVLDTFVLERGNGSPDLVSSFGFKDHVTTALAINYQASERLKLRAGASFGFDVKQARTTVSFPSDETIKFGLGAGYALNKRLSIDVAYSYVNNADVNIDSVSDIDGGVVSGDFVLKSNVFALQINHKL